MLAVVAVPAAPAAGTAVGPLTGNCVLLDSVQDPGNLGTILRTAAAVGIPDVLLTPGCAQAQPLMCCAPRWAPTSACASSKTS